MSGGWGGSFERLDDYLAGVEVKTPSIWSRIMAALKQKITPCLWFDNEAEDGGEALHRGLRQFADQKISRYTEAGRDMHGRPPGSVMVVEFELDGQTFTALNGGPQFKFNEAVSFQVMCDTQDEIDHFWTRLSEGGKEGPCGWLKDRFGLSWQIVPSVLPQLMKDADDAKSGRVMNAVMTMKKLDLDALQRAYSAPA